MTPSGAMEDLKKQTDREGGNFSFADGSNPRPAQVLQLTLDHSNWKTPGMKDASNENSMSQGELPEGENPELADEMGRKMMEAIQMEKWQNTAYKLEFSKQTPPHLEPNQQPGAGRMEGVQCVGGCGPKERNGAQTPTPFRAGRAAEPR